VEKSKKDRVDLDGVLSFGVLIMSKKNPKKSTGK